mgnify:CR=1 FL=1
MKPKIILYICRQLNLLVNQQTNKLANRQIDKLRIYDKELYKVICEINDVKVGD